MGGGGSDQPQQESVKFIIIYRVWFKMANMRSDIDISYIHLAYFHEYRGF